MKRLLTAVCALAILSPGLALAQGDPRDPNNRDLNDIGPGRGGRNGAAGSYRPRQQQPAPPQAQAPQAPPQARPDRGPRGDNDGRRERGDRETRGGRGDNDDRGQRFNGGRGGDNRGPGGDYRRDNDRRGFDNRGADRRFARPDFDDQRRFDRNRGERFRYGNRDFYRFRVQPYAWPRGYGVRSWRPREFLPRFFFEDRYYIDDFYALGLPPPPYGYRWLRVGEDALLVDLRTGLIADVIPGVFFW